MIELLYFKLLQLLCLLDCFVSFQILVLIPPEKVSISKYRKYVGTIYLGRRRGRLLRRRNYLWECIHRETHALDPKSAEICTRNTSCKIPLSSTWNTELFSSSVSRYKEVVCRCISSRLRNPLAHPPMLHHLKQTCLFPAVLRLRSSFISAP